MLIYLLSSLTRAYTGNIHGALTLHSQLGRIAFPVANLARVVAIDHPIYRFKRAGVLRTKRPVRSQ